ncbi:MAG: hypothetical protein M1497_13460 [Nitrospirae bacterium]|nr:hypothetical protein [Nitrospirota bacterium]
MDSGSTIVLVALLFSLTVLLNLPFGYFRGKAKKYSFRWFLCIHLPIPLIFAARVLSHLDYRYVPLFFLGALTGQLLGGRMGC